LLVFGVVYAVAEILPIGGGPQFAWVDGWGDFLGLSALGDHRALSLGAHLGLLLATALYFWRDMGDMAQGLVKMAKGKRDPGARLFFQLIVATLPLIAAVLGAQRLDTQPWQSPFVMAWSAFVVGLLLLLFDRACMTVKRIEHAGYGDVLILGIAQALAFVPGIGRIAVVIAVARMLGYERQDAARFAFLISIPTLVAACAWNGYGLVLAGQGFPVQTVLLTTGVTLITALIVLGILMNWLRRSTFTPFAIYRLLIGANLLVFAYDLF
jgi:undecaprenyl-diphosphatase